MSIHLLGLQLVRAYGQPYRCQLEVYSSWLRRVYLLRCSSAKWLPLAPNILFFWGGLNFVPHARRRLREDSGSLSYWRIRVLAYSLWQPSPINSKRLWCFANASSTIYIHSKHLPNVYRPASYMRSTAMHTPNTNRASSAIDGSYRHWSESVLSLCLKS